MSLRRWSIWLGPPIALVAIALGLSQLQPGAEAGGRVTPRPLGACAGTVPIGAAADAGRGTWWRLVDQLDGSGSLVGRTLLVGRAGATRLTLELGAESMASGPVGGLVVVASDNGQFSDVRLVSALEGCSWLVHRNKDVVRSAILDASSGTVLAHLVSREARADMGTWRIRGMEPDAALDLVLGPLPLQGDLGPVWATELRLDATGRRLAVQSCGEAGCVARIVSLEGPNGATAPVGGLDQGAIIGFLGKRLIAWAYCQGLPCAIQAWEPGDATPETLVQLAAGAAITGDGRTLVAVLDLTGRATRVDLVGAASERIQGIAAGELPLGAGIAAYAGFQVGPEEVAIAAPGADPHPFNPARAAPAP